MKEYIQNGNTEMCSLQQGKKDRQLDSSGDGISGLKPAVSLNIFTKSFPISLKKQSCKGGERSSPTSKGGLGGAGPPSECTALGCRVGF